jgi:hypothetical protein
MSYDFIPPLQPLDTPLDGDITGSEETRPYFNTIGFPNYLYLHVKARLEMIIPEALDHQQQLLPSEFHQFLSVVDIYILYHQIYTILK